MQPNNHRRHTRRACDVPVQLVSDGGHFEARIVDASRGGVRLRVAGSPLGLYRLAPLTYVSRQVARLLGIEFEARMDPARLGPLLSKRMRPVRIGQRDASSSDVELGCVLAHPFNDDEAGVLGLDLPKGEACDAPASPPPKGAKSHSTTNPPARLAVRPPDALPTSRRASERPVAPAATVPPPAPPPRAEPARAVPARAEGKPGPSKRGPTPERPPAAPPAVETARPSAWKAYVHPMGSDLAAPVEARTENVSAKGVQILIQDRELLQVGGEADVASTMAALGATYGSEVALRLVDGTTPLWTGPARIEMIEVGMQAPYPVTLWLAYGRALRPAELRALELA